MTNQSKVEQLIYRLMLLKPPVYSPGYPITSAVRAERAFGFSLLFSAVRCVLQYVVLPFVLPVIGIASDGAVPLVFMINLIAIAAVLYSVRRLWRIGYKYKWQYLVIGLTVLIIQSAFVYFDLRALG